MRLCTIGVVLALATLPGASGCYRWARMPHDSFRTGGADGRLNLVRLRAATGEREEIVLHRVEYPFVEGWSAARREVVRINLQEYQSVEMRWFNADATTLAVLGSIAGTAGLVGLYIILAMANSSW